MAEKLQAHAQKKQWKVCGQVLYAEGQSLVADELTEGLRNRCYMLRYAVFSLAKIQKYHVRPLQEDLSMQQQWCVKTQLSINTQMFPHLDQYLTCGHVPHIQKWPFPHSGSPSSFISTDCSLHCARQQLSPDSKI
jgi:hypothetical protein